MRVLGAMICRYRVRRALESMTSRQLADIGVYNEFDLEDAVRRAAL